MSSHRLVICAVALYVGLGSLTFMLTWRAARTFSSSAPRLGRLLGFALILWPLMQYRAVRAAVRAATSASSQPLSRHCEPAPAPSSPCDQERPRAPTDASGS